MLHSVFEERFGFPLIEVWGMTETSRMIANTQEPRHTHTRAFGRPRAPLEILVINEQGVPAERDEPGELLIRCAGENPRSGFFSSYVNDDVATQAAWRDGWFHTGDVVKQDADGMLYFVDRRKNIIRRSGENIAAAEIEEAIIAHPEVHNVAVLAVPDALRDEEPLACVVLANGQLADENKAREICQFARKSLSPSKLPGWIHFIEAIAVTATQKVRKDALLEGFNPGTSKNLFDMRPVKTRQPSALKSAK